LLQPIFVTSIENMMQRWNFVFGGCNNQLATEVISYIILFCKLNKFSITLNTACSFKASGLIIHAAMYATTIVSRLMLGDGFFFLDDKHSNPGSESLELKSRRQAN